MILVTAANGHQGRYVVRKLAAAGYQVRAARATAGRDEELLELGASEVFVGDLADPGTYARAVEEVDTIYHVGPAGAPSEVQMGMVMIDAALQAGVGHVVFSSVLHPHVDILQHRYKCEIEVALIESGLSYTILRPCDYMMPEVHVDVPWRTGEFPVFWQETTRRLHSFIAMEDLSDVVVKVIREQEAHFAAAYDLAGPDRLDGAEAARILSRVMGHPIRSEHVDPEDRLRAQWRSDDSHDLDEHRMEMLQSISRWYGQHDFIGNPSVLTWLLRRPPTSFEAFARARVAELRSTVPGLLEAGP
jgi:uncharacterized protein YbjT (DUF2867 family)